MHATLPHCLHSYPHACQVHETSCHAPDTPNSHPPLMRRPCRASRHPTCVLDAPEDSADRETGRVWASCSWCLGRVGGAGRASMGSLGESTASKKLSSLQHSASVALAPGNKCSWVHFDTEADWGWRERGDEGTAVGKGSVRMQGVCRGPRRGTSVPKLLYTLGKLIRRVACMM